MTPYLLGTLAAAALLVCPPSPAEEAAGDLAAADAAVRKTDAEWAAGAGAGAAGLDAWMGLYGADAIVLLPNEPLANRPEGVRRGAARLLALPRFSVAWHPIKVETARSGELAQLSGAYELHYADSRGAPQLQRGRLLEIWRKQTDGAWKCIVDLWSADDIAASPVNAMLPATPPAPAMPGALAPAVDPKYGAMPIHYEEAIRRHFQEHLKDPDSVQYQQIGIPEQGFTPGMTGNVLMRETRNYGWTVKATLDAKNSAGGYAGPKSYTFCSGARRSCTF